MPHFIGQIPVWHLSPNPVCEPWFLDSSLWPVASGYFTGFWSPSPQKSTTTTPRQTAPLCATPNLGYMTTNHKTRPIQPAVGLDAATPSLGHTSRATSSPSLRRMHRQARAAYPSIADEQNTTQMIENNQSRYTLSVNFFEPDRWRLRRGRWQLVSYSLLG
jgi:hypothetical protein